MRIFKLARRSVGLQSIAHTVRTSWKDLGLLFMLVGMGMLVFGSLLYYIETNVEDTSYVSIPAGMWWAVQTLTSLGYGDYWPGQLSAISISAMTHRSKIINLISFMQTPSWARSWARSRLCAACW